MNAWQELLKVALLGTERQTKAPVVDEALIPYMDQLYPGGQVPPDNQREAAYLSAAALISTYHRAGLQPQHFQNPLPAPSPESGQIIVNETAAAHLRLMMTDKELSPLLPEWLQVVADHRLCLPPLLLPQILNMAERQKSLRPAILNVIGDRGRWLAGQQESWQRIIDDAPLNNGKLNKNELDGISLEKDELNAALWETGTLAQRVAYLSRQRSLDPAQTHTLLLATWKQDSAGDRAALLQTLQVGLNPGDEEFLQSCLTDKSKEVRQRAAELLAQLPDSALSQRVKSRLQTWLNYAGRSGLMGTLSGKKGVLNVTLPEQWDKAWQLDGIVEKAPSGKGQKAWWLEQTLALIPPALWCAQWNLTAGEILALLPKHEWEEPLRAGLHQAIVLHKDRLFSEAWLRTISADENKLWELLEPEQSERLIADFISHARGDKLINTLYLLPRLQHRWSEPFSRTIVDAWRQVLSDARQRSAHYLSHLLKNTALSLHISAGDYFTQQLQAHLSFESPNYKPVQNAVDTLRFRQDMISAITNMTNATSTATTN